MKESDEKEEGEIERKILNHFNFLNDENNFQKIYDEYNFEKGKEKLTEIWENIIKYIYEEILHSLSLSLEQIKLYSIIHDCEPKGLNNILQYLRANFKYITIDDIKSDEFYEKNFPEIYPPPSPKSFPISIPISIPIPIPNPFKLLNPNLCREEKNENNDIECKRKDIPYNENIPDSAILFNYEILNSHCEALLMILKKILLENGQEIIKKDVALRNIKEGNIKLRYGVQNIEEVIYFLQKMKKIIIFEVEKDSKKYEFIKIAKNKDDSAEEKDRKIAKILISIDAQGGICYIIQDYIEKCLRLAKKNLKDNDRDKAMDIIKKHNKLQKLLDERKKMMKSLEKKIIDIQNGANYADEEEEKDNKEDKYDIICKKIDKIFEKELEIVEENDYKSEEINLELQKLIKEVSENRKSKSKIKKNEY